MQKGKKKEIKVAKKVVEKIAPKKTPKVTTTGLKDIEVKRNALIAEIKPKLLTNSQLKQGGSYIRTRYALESGYAAVLPEINFLGKKLGLRPIGLGTIRKP